MSRISSPLNLTAGLWQPVARWIRAANDRRTLADMPDYLLQDIGLRRDQIDGVGDAVYVADTIAPARASFRRSAEVIALSAGKAPNKPAAAKPKAA